MPPGKPASKSDLELQNGDEKPPFHYQSMPGHYKTVFTINSRKRNTMVAFIQTVAWIRNKATRDGTSFKKIPNINCPFIEVEEDYGEDFPFRDENGQELISYVEDVKRFSEQKYQIDVNLSKKLPDFYPAIIQDWDKLSKAWYMYTLTAKKLRVLESGSVTSGRLRSFKSIKSVLAVLANSHSGKVLGELEKKSTSDRHRNYDSDDHRKVARDFQELQDSGLAFLPKIAVDGG